MDLQADYKHRFVIFTDEAKEDIKRLSPLYKRFNDILVSIQIFLGDHAHNGKLVFPPLFMFQTQAYPDVPAFECYYTYDDQNVRIQGISVAEEEND